MRDQMYSSRRLRPMGRASSTFFSAAFSVEVNDSSDGAGRRDRTTGLSEGCVARSEVKTERRAGLESEADEVQVQCQFQSSSVRAELFSLLT